MYIQTNYELRTKMYVRYIRMCLIARLPVRLYVCTYESLAVCLCMRLAQIQRERNRKQATTLAIAASIYVYVCINFKIKFSLSWSAVEVASFVRSVRSVFGRFGFRILVLYVRFG